MNPTKFEKSFESLNSTGPYEDFSDFPDSKLRTEDGYVFTVHRSILARDNRYFHALFFGLERNKKDFLVRGIKGRILEMILQHIYNGSIRLTSSNISDLMVASDFYLADSLMLEIKHFAKHQIALNNCIPIYVTALKINYKDHLKDILRGSYRYIQTHFEDLVSHVDIRDIPLESMKQFLGDRNLCVRGERIIWLAIVRWTQGRREFSHRLCHVPDLLLSLKLADVDESLATEILCHNIVANNNFCKDLHQIKSKAEFENALSVLREYYGKCSVRPSDFYTHRRPGWMHLIARYRRPYLDHVLEVFITYDENLDVWRKLGEFYYNYFLPAYSTSIGHKFYLFKGFCNIVFDIFEKKQRNISFRRLRFGYQLVNLHDVIYAIGGKNSFSEGEVMDVEFYCSDSDEWFTAMPMMPIKSHSAVAFRDSIYVVGKSPDDLTMMAQVYDAHSDSWTMFSPPRILRENFALFAYHEKLYIAGGTNGSTIMKNVERFDFDRCTWEAMEDLPYAYSAPKAIILNERLVILNDLERNYVRNNYPPVLWNETKMSWELLDKSLDRIDLGFYFFCTIEDSETITKVLHENRNPGAEFEKSPFDETQIFSMF